MFGFLSMSERQSYNPRSWCLGFKDASGQPVNVGVQQDAEEFLNVFLDKLEAQLKGTRRPQCARAVACVSAPSRPGVQAATRSGWCRRCSRAPWSTRSFARRVAP